MTNIPKELLDQIPNWDFNTLYEHFELLEPEGKVKNKVDNGVKMDFPVEIILDQYYEEFPKTKKVRVYGFGTGALYEFKREIRERKKIMLQFIYDNYNQDVTERRVEIDEEQ